MKTSVLFATLLNATQAFVVLRSRSSVQGTGLSMVAEYFSLASAMIRESRDAASVDPLHAARDFDCPGFRKEKQYFPTFAQIVNPSNELTEDDISRPDAPKFQTTGGYEKARLEDLHLQILKETSPWTKALEYGASRIGELQAKIVGTDNPEYWLS